MGFSAFIRPCVESYTGFPSRLGQSAGSTFKLVNGLYSSLGIRVPEKEAEQWATMISHRITKTGATTYQH